MALNLAPAAHGQVVDPLLSLRVDSALGLFDPTINLPVSMSTNLKMIDVAGGVAASVAQSGNQASFSSTSRRFLDQFGLDEFEENQGGLYTEPAWTLGKGNHSVGLGYTWFHYTEFDGEPLDEAFDFADPFVGVFTDTNFSIDAHVLTLSYGKGITDNLDVYFILPFIRLEGAGQETLILEEGGLFPPGSFQRSFDHNDMGLGDISLRLKYAVCQDENKVFSIGGDLVFPTGDEDEFLGGGDFGYRIRALMSKKFGRFYPTVEIGYFWTTLDGSIQSLVSDINGVPVPRLEESDFDQFEYRVGIPFACSEKLTFSVEWIGSISEKFTQNDVAVSSRVDMGHLQEGLVLDLGLRVPIDDDGLRTDVTPFIAMEYRF